MPHVQQKFCRTRLLYIGAVLRVSAMQLRRPQWLDIVRFPGYLIPPICGRGIQSPALVRVTASESFHYHEETKTQTRVDSEPAAWASDLVAIL